MAQLGWIDGRDYTIDARFANGDQLASERIARELVAAGPDVILIPAEGALKTLLQHSKTVPIVIALAGDPVGGGFASSLRRPGGNVTGLLGYGADLTQKKVALLKEATPRMTHLGIFFEPADAASVAAAPEAQAAAKRLKLRFTIFELHQTTPVDQLVKEAIDRGIDGALVVDGYLTNLRKHEIAGSLTKAKLPSISGRPDGGGMISYASSRNANFRRAASYVDKILKGAAPGELPIEQPTSVQLIINLRVARTIGVTIPKELLVRADQVIE
jgi:putative tryptophan/tyrosine transport system substrate-binding protein